MDAERDKLVERQRYDSSAERVLSEYGSSPVLGVSAMRPALRPPYALYEAMIRRLLSPSMRALELGSGGGMHTRALVDTGAAVTASDISPKSLDLLVRSVPAPAGNLSTTVADIEALPFADSEFDVVASAGALSYGDPGRVRHEILRVLRPGGRFVCVDSLNDNPIYRFNRWLHHVRGARSASTLRRMPSLRSIDEYRLSFGQVEVWYFGAATFLVPFAARLGGELRAARWSDAVDRAVRVRRSAFKFVMVATKGT